jgi:hypothetical protein
MVQGQTQHDFPQEMLLIIQYNETQIYRDRIELACELSEIKVIVVLIDLCLSVHL